MNIDFPFVLVWLTFLSGVIWLLDYLFLAKSRAQKNKKEPWWVDYARSFFPIFLIVLVIRSFIIQPFRVPTGSLEPTIQPGDFVAVNQFAYGLRLPVLNKKIVNVGEPKRGDIAVFRFPANPKYDFIKRVVGLPGDHIVYKNKQLTINGKKIPQKFLKMGTDFEPPNQYINVQIKEENLLGVTHLIQLDPNHSPESYDVVVPKGQYFMMGDNRDESEDSRYWGFVPEANLVGKAFIVWLNFEVHQKYWFNWSRIGTKL